MAGGARDALAGGLADAAEALILEGTLPPGDVAKALRDVWIEEAEDMLPLARRPLDVWLRLHAALGGAFAVDGRLREDLRPTRPRRLYRGAAAGDERGMSWTPYRAIALHYAEQHRAGRLWAADVEPPWMLAGYGAGRLTEIVMDPSQVDPRAIESQVEPSAIWGDRDALRAARVGVATITP